MADNRIEILITATELASPAVERLRAELAALDAESQRLSLFNSSTLEPKNLSAASRVDYSRLDEARSSIDAMNRALDENAVKAAKAEEAFARFVMVSRASRGVEEFARGEGPAASAVAAKALEGKVESQSSLVAAAAEYEGRAAILGTAEAEATLIAANQAAAESYALVTAATAAYAGEQAVLAQALVETTAAQAAQDAASNAAVASQSAASIASAVAAYEGENLLKRGREDIGPVPAGAYDEGEAAFAEVASGVAAGGAFYGEDAGSQAAKDVEAAREADIQSYNEAGQAAEKFRAAEMAVHEATTADAAAAAASTGVFAKFGNVLREAFGIAAPKSAETKEAIQAYDALFTTAGKLNKGFAEVNETVKVGDQVLINYGQSGRHIIAIVDGLARGQRGQVFASFNALARDSGLLQTALQALAGPWGLVAGAAIAAAGAFAYFAYETYETNRSIDQIRGNLLDTGQVAEATADSIRNSFDSLENAYGISESSIRNVAVPLSRLTQVTPEQRTDLAHVAVNLAQQNRADETKTAESLAKELDVGGPQLAERAAAIGAITIAEKEYFDTLGAGAEYAAVLEKLLDFWHRNVSATEDATRALKDYNQAIATLNVGGGEAGAALALGGALGPRPPVNDKGELNKDTLARGRQYADYLMNSLGYTQSQAAATVGNLTGESSLNPLSEDSTGHRGLANWDKTRFANLQEFARTHGNEDPRDWSTQLQFFAQETRQMAPEFFTAPDIASQTSALVRRVEKPLNPDADVARRTGYAQQFQGAIQRETPHQADIERSLEKGNKQRDEQITLDGDIERAQERIKTLQGSIAQAAAGRNGPLVAQLDVQLQEANAAERNLEIRRANVHTLEEEEKHRQILADLERQKQVAQSKNDQSTFARVAQAEAAENIRYEGNTDASQAKARQILAQDQIRAGNDALQARIAQIRQEEAESVKAGEDSGQARIVAVQKELRAYEDAGKQQTEQYRNLQTQLIQAQTQAQSQSYQEFVAGERNKLEAVRNNVQATAQIYDDWLSKLQNVYHQDERIFKEVQREKARALREGVHQSLDAQLSAASTQTRLDQMGQRIVTSQEDVKVDHGEESKSQALAAEYDYVEKVGSAEEALYQKIIDLASNSLEEKQKAYEALAEVQMRTYEQESDLAKKAADDQKKSAEESEKVFTEFFSKVGSAGESFFDSMFGDASQRRDAAKNLLTGLDKDIFNSVLNAGSQYAAQGLAKVTGQQLAPGKGLSDLLGQSVGKLLGLGTSKTEQDTINQTLGKANDQRDKVLSTIEEIRNLLSQRGNLTEANIPRVAVTPTNTSSITSGPSGGTDTGSDVSVNIDQVGGSTLAGSASSALPVVPKFHSGGMVGVPSFDVGGLASNEVPAVLKQGERVLNVNETEAYHTTFGGASILDVRPRLHSGGLVGLPNFQTGGVAFDPTNVINVPDGSEAIRSSMREGFRSRWVPDQSFDHQAMRGAVRDGVRWGMADRSGASSTSSTFNFTSTYNNIASRDIDLSQGEDGAWADDWTRGVPRFHAGGVAGLPYFAKGGLAAGETPAILHVGERVLNLDETHAYHRMFPGGILGRQRYHAGGMVGLPRFAQGGLVPIAQGGVETVPVTTESRGFQGHYLQTVYPGPNWNLLRWLTIGSLAAVGGLTAANALFKKKGQDETDQDYVGGPDFEERSSPSETFVTSNVGQDFWSGSDPDLHPGGMVTTDDGGSAASALGTSSGNVPKFADGGSVIQFPISYQDMLIQRSKSMLQAQIEDELSKPTMDHAKIRDLESQMTTLNLPRFHDGGLASDEVPAILLEGERVLTRDEAGAYNAAFPNGIMGQRMQIGEPMKFHAGGNVVWPAFDSGGVADGSDVLTMDAGSAPSPSAPAPSDSSQVAGAQLSTSLDKVSSNLNVVSEDMSKLTNAFNRAATPSGGGSSAGSVGGITNDVSGIAGAVKGVGQLLGDNPIPSGGNGSSGGPSTDGGSSSFLSSATNAANGLAQVASSAAKVDPALSGLAQGVNLAQSAFSAISSVGSVVSGVGKAAGFIGSLFAFEGGGIVPSAAGGMIVSSGMGPTVNGGTLSLLHENEMVLPSRISQTVQDAARGATPPYLQGAQEAGDTHIHNWNINGVLNAHDVDKLLMSRASAVAKGFQRASRIGWDLPG